MIEQLNIVSCTIEMTIGGSPVARLEDADGRVGYYILEQRVDSLANNTAGKLYHWLINPGKSVGAGFKGAEVTPKFSSEQITDLINTAFIKLYGE